MLFQVNFKNKHSVSVKIDDNLTSTSQIEIPVYDIIELLHDICDDFDLIKESDKKELRFAVERLLGYIEEEEN